MSDAVKAISDAEFQTLVLNSQLPVLVDMWAPWCGPCRMLSPLLDELSKSYAGKVTFFKMNTDENPAVPNQFNIMSIPTLLLFKNGKLLDRSVGVKPKEALKKFIDQATA